MALAPWSQQSIAALLRERVFAIAVIIGGLDFLANH